MQNEELEGIEVFPEDPEELFEELENSGTGNFGVVIKARNRRTGEIVAIKQILITDKAELDNIQREILILRRCNHPNIVCYYGTYRSLGRLWIVMEYCEGGSVDLLYRYLRRAPPEKIIAFICRKVLLALEYLHEHCRLHRDIKGSNILLTRDGDVKLIDFGVSTELIHSLSKRNTFIGTVLWMAPEAILENDYDDKADIWSLGITLIEMAENGPPHSGMHVARAIFQIPREDPPTLRRKNQWSPQMNIFLKRLLTKDKNTRPGASAMLQDPFVQPENIATQEQMKHMVEEVLRGKEELRLRRMHRGGDLSSNGSTATFVRVSSSDSTGDEAGGGDGGAPASPRAADDPCASLDNSLLSLPLLLTQDLCFDALSFTQPELLPADKETKELYALLTEADGTRRRSAAAACVAPPEFIMQTTRTLAQAFRYHRELPMRLQEVSPDDKARALHLLHRYGIALKSIYHI